MPPLPTLGTFIVAVTILILIPGPAVIYIVNRGISQRRRAAVVSALGIETGALVHVVAAVAGLSAIIASSQALFRVITYVGAAYLVYLAVVAWRSSDGATVSTPMTRTSLHRVYAQGVLVNILNPKVGVFFLAFLPQFVSPQGGAAWLQMLVLGAVFLIIATTLDVGYALASGVIGEWLARRDALGRWRHRASGIAYAGLAAVVGLRH